MIRAWIRWLQLPFLLSETSLRMLLTDKQCIRDKMDLFIHFLLLISLIEPVVSKIARSLYVTQDCLLSDSHK